MTDAAVRTAGPQPPNPNTFNPTANVGTPIGSPVAQSLTEDATVVPAKADSPNTAYAVGLTSSAAAEDGNVHVQFAGPLTLTTAQWDARTGQVGGLTKGVPYYLSPSTAGGMTTVPTVVPGQFRAPLGIALTETSLLIQIMPIPVVNPGD
jgi:hypothetical protein